MRVLGVALLALCTLTESFLVPGPGCRTRRTHLFADVETRPKRRAPLRLSGYIQDPRDDRTISAVQESEMFKLVEQRATARREKNWAGADRILEKLQTEHNVQVYDGSAPLFARVVSRQNSAPLNVLKERYEKLYGPNCHHYNHVGPQALDSITCPLTMNDIHNALCRRLWLKGEKRFCEADAQLYELMTYGIEVNDSLKQWRCDGKVLFEKEWSKPPTQDLPYKEITSLVLPERRRVRVKQLVKQRAIAMARNDANLANALQYELFKTYEVSINDFDLTWQVNGDDDKSITTSIQSPFRTAATSHLPTMAALDPEHNWTRGGPYRYNEVVSAGRQLSVHAEVRVLDLLMQRDELRGIGHYVEADSIVNELWSTYEVDPHDARREYSVGRTFLEYNDKAAAGAPTATQPIIASSEESSNETELPKWWESYEESGLANTLHPNKASEVENLIKYLSSQQQRNPNIVDRLMVRLEEEYELLFDGSTWKIKGQIQQYAPVSSKMPALPALEFRKIQELVDMRNEQKFQRKNTGMAEIMEAGLRSKYKVVIDDETQTWYVDGSSQS
jgi:hypothetical protein